METIVIEKPVVITDMKKKVRDIQMAISWRDFANTYFQRSSSWFYHKMDGIDGNGGVGVVVLSQNGWDRRKRWCRWLQQRRSRANAWCLDRLIKPYS